MKSYSNLKIEITYFDNCDILDLSGGTLGDKWVNFPTKWNL